MTKDERFKITVRFEVLMALTVKSIIFWGVKP
jgi:hypothetical protein